MDTWCGLGLLLGSLWGPLRALGLHLVGDWGRFGALCGHLVCTWFALGVALGPFEEYPMVPWEKKNKPC